MMTTDSERAELAGETIQRLFRVRPEHEAGANEPAEAAELKATLFEHAFADSWTRTAIDDQTRSMITVALLAAAGGGRELRTHIHGALGLGVTPEQLVDVFVHVGVYAGVPRGNAAWEVVTEVLDARAAARARKVAK